MSQTQQQVQSDHEDAKEAYKEKKFEEALSRFSNIIKGNGDDSKALCYRSACFRELQKSQDALRDAIMCTKLNPGWWKGYAQKGYAEFDLEMYDEAHESFRNGLKLKGTSSKMIKKIKEIMSIKKTKLKNLLEADVQIAKGAFQRSDFQTAIDISTKIINQNPNEATTFANRSICYANLKKYTEALDDAIRCTELNPGWWKGFFRKGQSEFHLKKYDEAQVSFTKSLQLPGSDPIILTWIADLDKARKDLTVLGKRENNSIGSEEDPDPEKRERAGKIVEKPAPHLAFDIQPIRTFLTFFHDSQRYNQTLEDLDRANSKLEGLGTFKTMRKLLKKKIIEFENLNGIRIEMINDMSHYEGFIITVVRLLNNQFDQLETDQIKIGKSSDIVVCTEWNQAFARLIMFLSFFCSSPFVIYEQIGYYYRRPEEYRLYTIFTHYIIYMARVLQDDGFLEAYEFLVRIRDSVNTPNFNVKDLAINLSEEFIDKLYRFCCSEICRPFFQDLLSYCESMEQPSKTYKKYQTWDAFNENLLKKFIYQQLQEKLIVMPINFSDGTEGETSYNLRIFLSHRITSVFTTQREAILLVILIHEISHILRIWLMDDGVFFGTHTPKKFCVSEAVQKKKNLPDTAEIGFYLEEKYIFYDYLAELDLFRIPVLQATFLLTESNWKTKSFKEFFGKGEKQGNPSSPLHRKQKETGNHNRHYTYHIMKELTNIGQKDSINEASVNLDPSLVKEDTKKSESEIENVPE